MENDKRDLYRCMNEIEDSINDIHRERKKGKEIDSKTLEMLWWEMYDVKNEIDILINTPDEHTGR